MNNFKIPKIRFMNFNDKWDYKTLDEISKSIEYGLNASAKDFDGIHKYLRITDINDSSRLFLTDKLSSPDVDFTLEEYDSFKLQKNDLLFSRTGASVGKTYLYRDSDGEVYYAGFLIRARLGELSDGNFIFQQTLTDKYKRFIEITSQRSGQPGVNGKEYGDWALGITSLPEQSAIGSLFRTFDDLLNSYKGNLVNYQSLKATMLSKMFPKAGQTVPEIRLDGFEGEWTIKRADEIFKSVSEKNRASLPVLSASQVDGMVLRDEIGIDIKYDEAALNNYKVVKPGQFVIHLRSFQGGFALSKLEGITSPAYTIIDFIDKKNNIPDFWNSVLTSRDFIKRLETVTYGIRDGKSISFKDFSSLKFAYPELEEQQAIASYFSSLDQLITSYQEKITQLETLKKKFLQDMFI